MKKTEKDLEKTDIIDAKEETPDDEADVTRNINLDDLYDGAVNNTILLDPVTKDEVLMNNSKSNNNLILGVFLAIIILLGLYYVYNKSDLFTSDKPVTSNSTTTVAVTTNNSDTGELICNYQSKSDNETEDATYTFNYQDSKITKSKFVYSVVILSDSKSVVEQDIEKQYEDLYTKNSSLRGFNVRFSKSSKGFSFYATTYYNYVNFEQITQEDNKAVLFIKPSKDDTIESIKTTYDKKGYSCTINEK